MVSRPIDDASAVTATRMVMENPALGSALLATVVLFPYGSAPPLFLASE
jgi:hypothetical protein